MSTDLHRNGKTSFYTNDIKMRNYYNIYGGGIQENTGEYKRIQENTRESRRIQGNAKEYRGIQRNTCRRIQGNPQGDTREYKGIIWSSSRYTLRANVHKNQT